MPKIWILSKRFKRSEQLFDPTVCRNNITGCDVISNVRQILFGVRA